MKTRCLKFVTKWIHDIDHSFLSSVLFLSIFSFLLVGSSNLSISTRISVSAFFLLKKQIIFSFIGIFLMLFLSAMSFSAIYRVFYFFFILFLLLLVLNLFFGTVIKGSRRWVGVGSFLLQPGELMKPFFIVTQAGILNLKSSKFSLVLFFINSAAVLFLIVVQPDIGTAIIYMAITWVQLFVSGASRLATVIIPCVTGLGSVMSYLLLPHVRFRVDSFLNSELHYQAAQSINAIQAGGYFGSGLANGFLKYKIPDSYTDYIFSIFCEEFGYFGVLFFMFFFMKFFLRSFIMIKQNLIHDIMRLNICISAISVMFLQFAINVLVAINAVPTKGMPIPFLSYGGSSVLSAYILSGLMLALNRKGYGLYIDFYARR